jgi:hypothetical protein
MYPAGGGFLSVTLTYLDDASECSDTMAVPHLVTPEEVAACRDWIVERIDRTLFNGECLMASAAAVFPYLRFGTRAQSQVNALTGAEPVFPQLIRHLRALNQGARDWDLDTSYAPAGALAWSFESKSTLKHGRYGPMRDFSMPAGVAAERWSHHTKLMGGARLYFRAIRTDEGPIVLIGYFGDHLPTVEFP